MYLALWLISRWRLPATACLILPVAVSLKRFLTPLLVFSLGIFVSLCARRRDVCERPRQPFQPGRSILPMLERSGAYRGGGRRRQVRRGGAPSVENTLSGGDQPHRHRPFGDGHDHLPVGLELDAI